MEALSESLAWHGVITRRFEFDYMQRSRKYGRRCPPDRQPRLLDCFRQALEPALQELGSHQRLFIGGKSMGGRMASLLAASPELPSAVAGAACFGYPFHPPGKPDRWRTEHFAGMVCPLFIAHGTRDPFGRKAEVLAHPDVGPEIHWSWLEGGDHDFSPLARQPETQQQLIHQAASAAAAFFHDIP